MIHDHINSVGEQTRDIAFYILFSLLLSYIVQGEKKK